MNYPQCEYCDVPMEIISKDRTNFVCPECFMPVPRKPMSRRDRQMFERAVESINS